MTVHTKMDDFELRFSDGSIYLCEDPRIGRVGLLKKGFKTTCKSTTDKKRMFKCASTKGRIDTEYGKISFEGDFCTLDEITIKKKDFDNGAVGFDVEDGKPFFNETEFSETIQKIKSVVEKNTFSTDDYSKMRKSTESEKIF